MKADISEQKNRQEDAHREKQSPPGLFDTKWAGKIKVTRPTSRKKFDYVKTDYERKGNRWRKTDTKADTIDGATWKKLLTVFERRGTVQQEEFADGRIKVTVLDGDKYKSVFFLTPFIQKYRAGQPREQIYR